MRCLQKVQSDIWYANYTGSTPVVDDGGYDTGEKQLAYSDPVRIKAHASSARGMTDVDQFGDNVDYDRVILTDDQDIPITEETVMWVDTLPVLDNQGHTQTPWDYVVRRIARSRNYATIAIKKVKVS